jgi:hypothetical protein
MRRPLYLLVLVACMLAAAPAFGACTAREHHSVATGRSPSGKAWTVTATVHNDSSCDFWLLEMDFRPSGTLRGGSNWGWQIPAGGHLSNRFTISAQDETTDFDRAFYGAVSGRVRTIVLTMSSGERLTIHPKPPPQQLRRRFVWFRNMRYVVRYYPSGEHVEVARLLNSRGELISKARGLEGEFQGPRI